MAPACDRTTATTCVMIMLFMLFEVGVYFNDRRVK